MATALISHSVCVQHEISSGHPECPERIAAIANQLKRLGLYEKLVHSEAPVADTQHVLLAHPESYVELLRKSSPSSGSVQLDADTSMNPYSLEAALRGAGAGVLAVDQVISGQVQNAFCLVRPPGHHAEPGRGMGFCILNNIGITAKYLLETYKLKRILILDFDAHHGNGTQEMFYESENVLVVSLHQSGLFPFSGAVDEMGSDGGEGYNINIPVFAQFGDQEYTFLIGRLLQGIVEQFMPQIILVSAGYDGHKDDNMSGTLLTTEWFGTVTTMLKQFAKETCENRLMYILEGGYNPVSLEASVLTTLESLRRNDIGKIGILNAKRATDLLHTHPLQRYWTVQ